MFLKWCLFVFFLQKRVQSAGGRAERQDRFMYNQDEDLKELVHQLVAEVKQLKAENEDLKTSFNEQSSKGSTYVHWGRSDCPGNGSSLVYGGYIGGSKYNQKGGGASNLCLPQQPSWANYSDTLEEVRGRIYGAEFESDEADSSNFPGYYSRRQEIPCALCKGTRHAVMIPVQTNCFPGWTVEYGGYLMSPYYNYPSNGDFLCVDTHMEFVGQSDKDDDDHLLYLVEGRCGSLPCPPYVDGRELACVVCSI